MSICIHLGYSERTIASEGEPRTLERLIQYRLNFFLAFLSPPSWHLLPLFLMSINRRVEHAERSFIQLASELVMELAFLPCIQVSLDLCNCEPFKLSQKRILVDNFSEINSANFPENIFNRHK